MTPEELREELKKMMRGSDLNASDIEDTRGEVVLGIEDEKSGDLFFVVINPA